MCVCFLLAQQGVGKLFKNETLSFIFKVFSNALLGVGKLKSFLKIIQNHNNQMPPLNISQNVFTNYKRARFEYRKLLGCELESRGTRRRMSHLPRGS